MWCVKSEGMHGAGRLPEPLHLCGPAQGLPAGGPPAYNMLSWSLDWVTCVGVPMHSMSRLVQPLHWQQSGWDLFSQCMGDSLAGTCCGVHASIQSTHSLFATYLLQSGGIPLQGLWHDQAAEPRQPLHVEGGCVLGPACPGVCEELAVLSFGAAWL